MWRKDVKVTETDEKLVRAPSLANTYIDWLLAKVAEQSNGGASADSNRVTDLVYCRIA